jgi:adhesin PapG
MFKSNFFILVVLYLIGFPTISMADFRHFIWTMQTPVTISDIHLDYDDSTTYASGSVSGGLYGIHQGINVYQNCKGNNDYLSATQEKTAWLIIQNKVYVGSVPISINIDAYNNWKLPGQSPLYNYSSKINQITVYTALGDCFPLGPFGSVDFHWHDAKITVSMSSGNLPPGVYRVPVTYYYAYEENKFTDNDRGPSSDVPNLIVNGLGTQSKFMLNITVRSKCDFNNNPLKLIHDITLGNPSSYSSDLASYSISCTASTPVKLELLGATKIPGKSNNYTKCGESECELKFKDGTSVSDGYISGKKDFIVNSTFHPTNETKAGTFQGAGILRVTIN